VSESPALTEPLVAAVWRQLLGRQPRPDEVAAQVAGGGDLDGLMQMVLESAEYGQRRREADSRRPALVNVWHPDLAPYGLPPGTRSDDDIAIVGHDGSLFLCGGTNANLGQYVGAVTMEPGWLEGWRDVVLERREEMREMGLASATLIVPDKLAVYEERYPEPLEKVGPRPAERLLGLSEPELLYPLAELRTAARTDDVYLRTDTHLTFRGNEHLFRALTGPLAIDPSSVPDFAAMPLRSYPITGDLGMKFDPRIVSVVSEPNTLGAAEIVEDNRAEIEAVGGHIGTRRVFRNESAPDRRVAILFGDSFGFSAAYYQGVSWFMAQVFREVHFVWIPFGWDPDYVRQVGGEAVLVQGAERFAARVPHLRTEVSRLAAETLQRKQAIAIDSVLD
jgi:alginate O-acetyltransferase complex protein AlgJ